ncbi:MAG: terpene cyclase/mutase family protein [Planctomycetota bacterium]|nr:terpene cyclase/mutase family protein [Planctomycetota bacterium]
MTSDNALMTIANSQDLREETLSFVRACLRPDGGYAPSPDAQYPGNSDTGLSDLAAVTYAAVLAKTLGCELPRSEASVEFIHKHQRSDGSFVNLGGTMKPGDDLAILYNTAQGVVSLRALGHKPRIDPTPVMRRFFEGEAYRKLPWYTTSFFPLFYAALGQPFPAHCRKALSDHMIANQTEDGYLQNHIAAAFHMAHFYRLVGEKTPRAREMVKRALRDQKPDGGWNILQPSWDVHACFDALFVLRQLGGDSAECRRAIARAAEWAMSCRNPDGGFGHFPGWHSDMDAVYFQFGTLIQAELIPGVRRDLPDAHTLSWGHAMLPGKQY